QDGQLSLIADRTLRLFNLSGALNSFVGLIDAPQVLLPSVTNPISGAGGLRVSFIDSGANSSFELHLPQALHADDGEPVRIYSLSGDIIDGNDDHRGAVIVAADKPALLNAGRDIVNLSFRGQNLYDSDVTQISAGRDVYDPPLGLQGSVPFIELGGPGALVVRAGRDVGPITSANDALALGYLRPNDASYPGIRTIGSQNNAYLPREGADIVVGFGTGPGIELQAFAANYLDPSVPHNPSDPADELGTPDYSQRLISFVARYQTDQRRRAGVDGEANTPSAAEAWDAFRLMPDYQQQSLVYSVFFDILNRTGLDFNDPDSRYSQQYARGYHAVETLFPAAFGYSANDLGGSRNGALERIATGTFDMRGSTVQTQQGGDISVLGPGGSVLVGSASAPPLVASSSSSAGIGPNNQGILTLEQGAISIFTDRDVLLAQSRIFTEQGGDLVIWSSNGDINAGKGAKTSSEIPPAQFLCDPDHFCLVDAKSQVSGAGIAVLQTRPDSPSGTANLVAPAGTVDAGDAGIRVSGSLNVAALRVANADNIQVSGNSVGVPSSAVNSGALSAGNSVAASASQNADQLAASRPQEQAALAITVEVLGFGGGGGGDDCAPPQKRRKDGSCEAAQ
ncbi:MAG TPA: filamentous hemagglutinin family protein, partial [Solimonas sp.]|nr:filamentous hemagglutinin family protein [Solimonas sp.]